MKVSKGVWVVKISYDYEWATIYAKYDSIEEANKYCDLAERDYGAFKVRWLHEGEELPNTKELYD